MNGHGQPKGSDIGILAIEAYVPDTCVLAVDLENADGVSPGKYTVGLGQEALAFCSPREDAVSMALTATSRLLTKWNIPSESIGRLEVGSESNPDRSKSIKSHLMRILIPTNHDVLGTDCVHACYGGTAALLNALSWCSSCLWDGRLALVVATDVAAYAQGPARPTGGAAAVAMLVGPDAPLALVPGTVCSYFDAQDEFCKTHGLFPVVRVFLTCPVCYTHEMYCTQFDGPATVQQYLRALEHTTHMLRRRAPSWCDALASPEQPLLPHIDHAVFHAPYNKMVQKAWRRLLELDRSMPSRSGTASPAESPPAESSSGTSPLAADTAITSRDPMAASACSLRQSSILTDPSWHAVAAGAHGQRLVGNCYCASVFVGLASLVEAHGTALCGHTVLVFSFGSGVASSLMLLRGRQPARGPFSLEALASRVQLRARLQARKAHPPAVMAQCVELLHRRYCGQWQGTVESLENPPVQVPAPDVWRLVSLRDCGRPVYGC